MDKSKGQSQKKKVEKEVSEYNHRPQKNKGLEESDVEESPWSNKTPILK